MEHELNNIYIRNAQMRVNLPRFDKGVVKDNRTDTTNNKDSEWNSKVIMENDQS